MDPANETALVRRARQGSDDAFSRLVAQHQQAVRAFLRRLAGDEADDLAQDAFVTAWSRLDRLRDGVSFRTFVCGIAYRKALNDRRRFGRQARRDSEWHDLMPQQTTSTADTRLSLQTALGQLPIDQRAAISLCVAADYSHSEAAEILGLPLGTVKSHIQKGRERLSALLGVAS